MPVGEYLARNNGEGSGIYDIVPLLFLLLLLLVRLIIIIIIIIISCHRFSFFLGTSALEPAVNPTTQASSLSL
jgi:hypothetical protein